MVAGDVVEEMCADDSEIAVDRRSCPTKKCPAFGRILGNIWVSMVQESDHDDEVVDDTPRNDIYPKDQLKALQGPVKEVKAGHRRQTANVT